MTEKNRTLVKAFICILYAFTIDQENDQISDLGPPWGLYLSFKKTKLLVGEDVEQKLKIWYLGVTVLKMFLKFPRVCRWYHGILQW